MDPIVVYSLAMEQIRKTLQQIITKAYDTDSVPMFDRPLPKFGDLSTNVAMVIASKTKQNPRKIAEDIAAQLSDAKLEGVVGVSVAGAGFINIALDDQFFIKCLDSLSSTPPELSTQKIVVEYGQPNTHKMPHIGHLFSYIYGESIARIHQSFGFEVIRANYQGDVGPHVSRCIYGWRKLGCPGKDQPEGLVERARILQKAYQEGTEAYESSSGAKEEIDKLNKQIYQKDPSILEDWQTTRQWSIDYYKKFEEQLGIGEQKHYFESEVWQKGKELVEQNIGSLFTESDGAIVYDESKSGLHTRVFITSNGTPTYEAKELGLSWQKWQDWAFDLNLTSTAAEQNEYFMVAFDAASKIMPKLSGRLKHIGFGFIDLVSGKMSSRTGNIVTAPDLIESVRGKITQINPSADPELVDDLTNAAIKFDFLKTSIKKNISFDPDRSIDPQGDTGPYVQYTNARINSILSKTEANPDQSYTGALLPIEKELIKDMQDMYTLNETAIKKLDPHYICEGLIRLCRNFNSYYQQHSIIGSDSEAFRIKLLGHISFHLESGLTLLGINAPKSI